MNVTVPKFSRVEDDIRWFKDNNRWEDNNLGNLIFFDWSNNLDHVEIVEKRDDMYIYFIEGNSDDECKEKVFTEY